MSSARWCPDKDVRAIAVDCQRMGWEVVKHGTNHLLVIAPNGERVSMSSTPSAQNSVRVYRAKVNKIVKQLKGEKA
jgi:hypothetical protein